MVKGVTGAEEKKVLLFGLGFHEGGQLFQPLWVVAMALMVDFAADCPTNGAVGLIVGK